MERKYSIFFRLFIYVFGIYYGIQVALQMLIIMFKLGPRRFFHIKKRRQPPACLTDKTLGESKFITLESSGIRLHYVAAGKAGAPLMLFLHGFPEFWYSWRYQLREFSKDYRAVAIDMRGYAESDKPKGLNKYTVDKLALDVKDVIKGLGYAHCTLVSHDWGGAVAYSTALLYPEVVKRLIVCNSPHPRAMQKTLENNRKQLGKSWYFFFFQLPWLPEMNSSYDDLKALNKMFTGYLGGVKIGMNRTDCMTDEDIEAYKYTFSQPGRLTPPINYYRAAAVYQPPRYKELTITMPFLMIWGDADGALEASLAEDSASYAKKAVVRYVVGCSHWVQQEEPEKVNEYMRQFLKDNE